MEFLNKIKSKLFKTKYIYFILLLIVVLIKYIFLLYKKIIINIKIKVCICTVGKLENNYIKEFIIHYKKYGVDKIYLYDNNDLDSERFEDVISDYIKNDYVQLFNYRGKTPKQLRIYNHCYKLNNNKYDWLIFYDIDEFIYLKNFNNIKEFLILKRFNNCKSIYLNWIKHTDNNLLYYENKSIFKRFPEIFKSKRYCLGKTIIRGKIKNFHSHSTHILDKNVEKCNGFGNIINFRKKIFCRKPDLKYNFIEHYEYKSTEEFINKISKGDCLFGYGIKIKYSRIKRYFKYNKITKEKIYLIQNKTGLNISSFLNLIKNKK